MFAAELYSLNKANSGRGAPAGSGLPAGEPPAAAASRHINEAATAYTAAMFLWKFLLQARRLLRLLFLKSFNLSLPENKMNRSGKQP